MISWRYSSEFGDSPPSVTDADTKILRYCTDMQALDLGHQYFTDLSFLEQADAKGHHCL